ncbi:MAG: HNH endonuclease signature motif containing protein [Micropruina sp.]
MPGTRVVFAGCNRPAADCDAHHIVPWQQGGATSLANLCLLCKHHHNLLEPDARRPPDLHGSSGSAMMESLR